MSSFISQVDLIILWHLRRKASMSTSMLWPFNTETKLPWFPEHSVIGSFYLFSQEPKLVIPNIWKHGHAGWGETLQCHETPQIAPVITIWGMFHGGGVVVEVLPCRGARTVGENNVVQSSTVYGFEITKTLRMLNSRNNTSLYLSVRLCRVRWTVNRFFK